MGWALLLFCPAIISQPKHFAQKNSSTQINLGEGEGTYSFSSEIINCTLTSFFLCSMFNEWSSVGCHNGKSPHEEYFSQTHCCPNWERNCSRNDLQSQPKSPIYKGAANKPILAAMPENGPEEKAAVCSTFLKSLSHFFIFLTRTEVFEWSAWIGTWQCDLYNVAAVHTMYNEFSAHHI